jgi:hypothetical protein
MLDLDDPRWQTLEGGYRVLYDASPALKALEAGEDVWEELWQELHHQGDLGPAAYAAVPQLARIAARAPRHWNFYALVATIEIERHRNTNPPVPPWLAADYHAAWEAILRLALQDLPAAEEALLVQSLLGCIALAKGDAVLGMLIAHNDRSEIEAMVAEADPAWSGLHESKGRP